MYSASLSRRAQRPLFPDSGVKADMLVGPSCAILHTSNLARRCVQTGHKTGLGNPFIVPARAGRLPPTPPGMFGQKGRSKQMVQCHATFLCAGAQLVISLLSSLRLDGLLNLLLDGLQVEACTLLHGRELDRGLGDLCHLLLHELEAPELVDEPVVIAD